MPGMNHVQTINWYKERLIYFKENVGRETEFGTLITNKLISATKKRLTQLYNGNATSIKI